MKLLLVLLVVTFSFVKLSGQTSLYLVPAKLVVDTSKTKDKRTLLNKIIFEKKVIRINACYEYHSTDFSYLYPSLLKSVDVFFDDGKAFCSRDKYKPDLQRYLMAWDSVFIYKSGDTTNYLIMGKPFFCSGHFCSDVSVLVVRVFKNEVPECFEVNTMYCDTRELYRDIISHYKKFAELRLPIANKCNSNPKTTYWVF